MVMRMLRNHPRLSGLLIGFGLGLITTAISNHWANATVTEFKLIATKREKSYEELLQKSRTKIETLAKINESLSQTVRKRVVTKPDGTITEEIDTETDSTKSSETEIRKSVTIEYERKLAEERFEHSSQMNTATQRKLTIGAGVTTEREYYVHGSYPVWGPITVGGGATSSGTMLIDIGISL